MPLKIFFYKRLGKKLCGAIVDNLWNCGENC